MIMEDYIISFLVNHDLGGLLFTKKAQFSSISCEFLDDLNLDVLLRVKSYQYQIDIFCKQCSLGVLMCSHSKGSILLIYFAKKVCGRWGQKTLLLILYVLIFLLTAYILQAPSCWPTFSFYILLFIHTQFKFQYIEVVLENLYTTLALYST